MSWLRRYQQRQRDLARGVDADLVRDNRNRLRWAAYLSCALAFPAIAHILSLPQALRIAADMIAIPCAIVAIVLFPWSMATNRFLRKPDPEPPPSIFKD